MTRKNLKKVFELVKEHGPISKEDYVVKKSGLKPSTFRDTANDLFRAGYFTKAAMQDARPGRPKVYYELKEEFK